MGKRKYFCLDGDMFWSLSSKPKKEGVSVEVHSDTLELFPKEAIAALMGRGLYEFDNATHEERELFDELFPDKGVFEE